jgi:hypothetical protein
MTADIFHLDTYLIASILESYRVLESHRSVLPRLLMLRSVRLRRGLYKNFDNILVFIYSAHR